MSGALTIERRPEIEQGLARLGSVIYQAAVEEAPKDLQRAAWSFALAKRIGDRRRIAEASKRLQNAAIEWDAFCDVWFEGER